MFLDIETTGLKPDKSSITIIGVSSHLGIQQFYSESEHSLLHEFSKFLSTNQFKTLVTYNGAAFDIPFLQARATAQNVSISLPEHHKDLYEFRRAELEIQKAETGNKGYVSATQSVTCEKYGIYVPRNSSGEFMAKLMNRPPHKIEAQDVQELFLHNAIDLFALSSLYYQMKRFGIVGESFGAYV